MRKRKILLTEFAIQVYSDGRIVWKAVEEFEKVLALAGKVPPVEASVKALIGYAYAAAGNRVEALELATEVSTLSAAPPYHIAAWPIEQEFLSHPLRPRAASARRRRQKEDFLLTRSGESIPPAPSAPRIS